MVPQMTWVRILSQSILGTFLIQGFFKTPSNIISAVDWSEAWFTDHSGPDLQPGPFLGRDIVD